MDSAQLRFAARRPTLESASWRHRGRTAMLESRIVRGVAPERLSRRQFEREFRALLASGVRIRAAGTARARPGPLAARYAPRYAIRLFDTVYYLTDLLH